MKQRLRRLLRRLLGYFYTQQVSLKSEAYKITFFLSLLILLTMTVGLLLGQANSALSALHWAIRVLFEDFDSLESYPTHIYPIAFFLKLSGHMFVPLFITFLTAKILSIRLLKQDARHFQGHLIVLGTPAETELFLKQLFYGGIEEVVMVSPLEYFPSLPLEMRLLVLPPSKSLEQDLLKSNVKEAKYLLVLPEQGESQSDFEARVVLAAVTAKRLNRRLHILLSALEGENREHLLQLGIDEVLIQGELFASFLAQCVLHPGFSLFFDEILATGYGNCLALEELPQKYWGVPFDEALIQMKERQNWLLLGVQRKGKVLTNPQKLCLEEGDRVFILKEQKWS